MHRRILLPTLLLLAPFAGAQMQASTLDALTRKAQVVLTARVSSVRKAQGQLRTVFLPERIWKGKLSVAPVLSEPLGRHCSSALAGAEAGQRFLVFAIELEETLRLLGGRRGLVHLEDGLLDAVRRLLGTSSAQQRLRILASQLDHSVERVRVDAALALPLVPSLEAADRSIKNRIEAALTRAREAPASPTLFGLLPAARRAIPMKAASSSWSIYLDDSRTDLHAFVAHLLVRDLAVETVLATAPVTVETSAAARARLANLLAEVGDARALPLLRELLTDKRAPVRKATAVALLRLGQDRHMLARVVGADVTASAEATLRATRRRRFRAILRGHR